MHPEWNLLHPRATYEMLGYIPMFLVVSDTRKAAEQFNDRYAYGGWDPFQGMTFDDKNLTLKYPGDPPMMAIAETYFRDERIILFDCAWVAIIQKDGSYEISRMD